MAGSVRTSRGRGSVCGLLLVLLGGWAGVAPFAGPVLRFGYRPDQAWAYTQGRLYLSAVPGGLAVLTGLILIVTRSRGFGGFCAVVAALAGAWLIAGSALIRLLPASLSGQVTTGAVLEAGAHRAITTSWAFFAGPGTLIVFVAALALGRLSLVAYKDYLRWAPPDDTGAGVGLAGIGLSSSPGPGYGYYNDQAAPTQDLYGTGASPGTGNPAGFPAEPYQAPAGQQYPVHDPFGLTQDYPSAAPGQTAPDQTRPDQAGPGVIGPGGRLERKYPPSQQPPG